ncbi:glycosyltransferase [Actinobacteria bacterium YIM 96077]|uniref:Glycosyltransferase n=2 Tax=Phytoactinopolyspora halophila TaxID=1981511 RepID=A0A329QIE1_9ACTN|nr:glycosyltransferase [Actinobacteria bacterium YIM 96077]RAW12006.1 glycosyltransferase [Phytoactinopolyspora halophila]
MKVLLLTNGTRGDIQPFVALAIELVRAGHEVTLALPDALSPLAEAYNIRTKPLNNKLNRLLTGSEYRALVWDADRHTLTRLKRTIRLFGEDASSMVGGLENISAAADEGADVIVHHATLPAHHVAEKLAVPAVPVCLHPSWVPTSSFAHPAFRFGSSRVINRASYSITKAFPTNLVMNALLRRAIDRWRQETLGLDLRRNRHDILRRPDGGPVTVLQAFSPVVLPSPLDYPSWVHTTGFWRLPNSHEFEPNQDLRDFLASGDSPVYVGFGSMVGSNPEHTTRIVAEALKRVDVRAIVATGWGAIEPEAFGEKVLCINETQHDWLFPRTRAIVHHGGAGTMSIALASGRPQVLCPFIVDQPFNARRLYEIGVASAPQPQRRLTSEDLAQAINRAVTDRVMSYRAEQLGARVRAENGTACAVKILESLV